MNKQVPLYDYQLMQAKMSLYNYLTRRYGRLQENKRKWIEALNRMLEHGFRMTLIEEEAVRSTLRELKIRKRKKKRKKR